MLETLLIGGIAVGLGRDAGGRWSWTRERAERRLRSATERLGPPLARFRTALPGILARCVADVRSLAEDLLGALDPKTRRVVRERIAPLLEPPSPSAGSVAPGAEAAPGARASGADSGTAAATGAGAAAGPGAATSAVRALQKRYLEGAISLDQYRREVRRLRAEPT